MARPLAVSLIVAVLLVVASVVARGAGAQEGTSAERQHWDWGQHRTRLMDEPAPLPAVPAPLLEHWDYPGAPVRFAGQPNLS